MKMLLPLLESKLFCACDTSYIIFDYLIIKMYQLNIFFNPIIYNISFFLELNTDSLGFSLFQEKTRRHKRKAINFS